MSLRKFNVKELQDMQTIGLQLIRLKNKILLIPSTCDFLILLNSINMNGTILINCIGLVRKL